MAACLFDGFSRGEVVELQHFAVELDGGFFALRKGLRLAERFRFHGVDAAWGDNHMVDVEVAAWKIVHHDAAFGDEAVQLHAGHAFSEEAVTGLFLVP